VTSSSMLPVGRGRASSHSLNKCVLFIDDDEQLLSLLKLSLEGLGFTILTAPNGTDGLQIVGKQSVDLVVLDYKMPDMDGEAVARELRRLRPILPIIMYSGVLEKVPTRVLELVDEFVSKQEPVSSLVHYIPRALARADRPRRAFLRHPIHAPFVVVDEVDGGVIHGQGCDLSEAGFGGILDERLPTGRVVRLQIVISSDLTLSVQSEVRNQAGARHGFKFLDPTTAQTQLIRRTYS
jgi:CheY-like chemotaxis protein